MTSYADTDVAELIWSPKDHPGEFVIKVDLTHFAGTGMAEVVLPREKVVNLIGEFIRELSTEERILRGASMIREGT
jgi:hypothetical protein